MKTTSQWAISYYDLELEDSVLVNELFAAVDSQGFLSWYCTPAGSAKFPGKILLRNILVAYHPLVFHDRLMIRGMVKIMPHF